MGRLDNIIRRNRGPNRIQERVIVSMVLGAIILLILVLAVFTDLGLPPGAAEVRDRPTGGSAGSGAATAPAPGHGKRVDGVLLGVPRRPGQR